MEDIVLNGVSIADLKKQKAAIQQDASKFIADGVEKVKSLVGQIAKVGDDDSLDVDALAKEALTVLDNVQIVSSVSGVEYYLPYSCQYMGHIGEVMSSALENAFYEAGKKQPSTVSDLYYTLEDMECTVAVWNTSNC